MQRALQYRSIRAGLALIAVVFTTSSCTGRSRDSGDGSRADAGLAGADASTLDARPPAADDAGEDAELQANDGGPPDSMVEADAGECGDGLCTAAAVETCDSCPADCVCQRPGWCPFAPNEIYCEDACFNAIWACENCDLDICTYEPGDLEGCVSFCEDILHGPCPTMMDVSVFGCWQQAGTTCPASPSEGYRRCRQEADCSAYDVPYDPVTCG